ELDAEWKPTKRLVRGYGIVASEEIGTATITDVGSGYSNGYHYYHQNEHGDIEYITGKDGKIENAYTYDAFGNITNSTELIKNRYTYNGEQYDNTTSQYYLRARYYNPLIARFTQEDVYRGDGLNLYAYCDSNPVMYVDPSGYDSNKCGTGSEDGSSSSKGGTNSGLPVNEDGNIVFYHGTTSEAAISIRNNGVDLNHANRDMDFGRGFYVTTDEAQARTWADRLGSKNKTSGDVVVFEISEKEFNKLNNKYYGSTDATWGNAVISGRNGIQPPYDTVSGPMLRNVPQAVSGRQMPLGDGQQTTFLTKQAIDTLNNGMKR
ncbi:MAG: DUF3990 domain-containing protein, partial [Lachnospiraceae bacterium]|nr:DUF3990 domain-containing protein [Lachnospiraceae bacterium]